MKKIFFLTLTTIALFVFSTYASIFISNHGSYENDDIILSLRYEWGNSTPTPNRPVVSFHKVIFDIESQKGREISNESYLIFEGKQYIFYSAEIKDSFYEKGYRLLANKRIRSDQIITIVYHVRTKDASNSNSVRKITKKLKIVFPKKFLYRNSVLKIVEIR